MPIKRLQFYENMTRTDILIAVSQIDTAPREDVEKLVNIMYQKIENVYKLLFDLENIDASESSPAGAIIQVTARELRSRLEKG